MPQREVSITTPDGTCPATLHTPEDTGSWPAVIMYPDAGGGRGTFHAMAQTLADLGYAVLLPDLYYRVGPYEPFDLRTAFTDPDERTRLMELVQSVTEPMVTRDTGAFLSFLLAQPEVRGDKVGTTGYCMGGSFALSAAGRYPDQVGAAASFHGGRLASDAPESPHLLAGSMRATVYVAAAENDRTFPQEQYDRLEAALTDAGVRHTLEMYPAAHGFAVPDNPSYDEAAAARHWEALVELFSTLT